MIALAKAVLLIARYFRRMAVSLEKIEELYRADCLSRGVIVMKPSVVEELEVAYSSKPVEW